MTIAVVMIAVTPVVFALETVMIETSSRKILPMFPIEPVVVVLEINMVPVMPMPGGIGIISVSGVVRFIDRDMRTNRLSVRRTGD